MTKKTIHKQSTEFVDLSNAKNHTKNPSMAVEPQPRTGAVTRSATAHAHTQPPNEPWIYRYTTSTFDKLHALLYPILHELAMSPDNDQSYFTKRWKHLTKQYV